MQRVWVQFPVRELRAHLWHGTDKRKKKKNSHSPVTHSIITVGELYCKTSRTPVKFQWDNMYKMCSINLKHLKFIYFIAIKMPFYLPEFFIKIF